jgi:hypothetical protein
LIQAYLSHAAKIELVLPCVAKSYDPHAATAVGDHQSEISAIGIGAGPEERGLD